MRNHFLWRALLKLAQPWLDAIERINNTLVSSAHFPVVSFFLHMFEKILKRMNHYKLVAIERNEKK